MQHIESFARRSGRMTSGQKHALLHYRVQMHLCSTNLVGVLDWLTHPNVVLEIGFGNGESLLEMAKQSSNDRFLGVEVHLPGAGHLMNEAHQIGLGNLKIMTEDVYLLFFSGLLGSAQFKRIQIYFPDPWHKKRHAKRRLLQPSFISKLDISLQKGGVFHFATDYQPYFLDVERDMKRFNYTQHHTSSDGVDYVRPTTKFERRGIDLGHNIYEAVFRKPMV